MLELSWSFVLCNFKLLFAVLHRVVFPSVSVHVAHIYACMDCCLIRATRGVVISFDAVYWVVVWQDGLVVVVVASPPRCTDVDSAMRSSSTCVHVLKGFWPAGW